MRKDLRFVSSADVYVEGKGNNKTKAILRDVSLSGLSIQTEGYIDIEPDSPYVIAIIPEKETNLEKFQLEIQARWIKLNRTQMESGFSVIVPFNKDQFEDYLEYLAMRGKIQTLPDEKS